MPFHQPDRIRFYTFDLLDEAGVLNAAITRRGGVSPQPWDSLNVGGTVGDDPVRVTENRRRAFQALGKTIESQFDVWQVHGAEVVCAHTPRRPDEAHQKADAILTDQPGVTLFMRFADCVPIFLFDPFKKVVGLAHAGWQGVVRQTAFYAIQAMQRSYGSSPANILAAIGPSIGPHHYEVGPEVAAQVRQTFGADAAELLQPSGNQNGDGRAFLDLWSANRLILQRAGVRQIEIAGICTACGVDDWYSHRAEQGRTGRFGALIAL